MPAIDPDHAQAPGPDPWLHAERIGRQLLIWAVGSVGVGVLVLRPAAAVAGGDAAALLNAVSLQFVVWGAIDGVIAVFGNRDRRRRLALDEDLDPEATAAFAKRQRRLLRLNAWLDVGYVAAALALAIAWRTPEGLGHALGVGIQGTFLLIFDVAHLRWRGGPAAPRTTDRT